jgi:thioesterase domain-containing protein
VREPVASHEDAALPGTVTPRGRKPVRTLHPRSNQIVGIREEGHKTPVIVLNNTAVLFPLAKALGDERPLYALQLCPATSPVALPDRDFRDLARDVVDLVRACRPEGPYVLMGLCVFGGLAMDAAQQLYDAGETVELVVINDAWAAGYDDSLTWHARTLRALIKRAHNVRLDLHRVIHGKKSVSELVASYSLLRRLKIVEAGMRLGILTPAIDQAVMRAENRWYTDYLLAARGRYQERPYHGDVLVMRSEETLTGRYFSDDLGWRSVVKGRLHVMDRPGTHDEMYSSASCEVMARGMRIMLRD